MAKNFLFTIAFTLIAISNSVGQMVPLRTFQIYLSGEVLDNEAPGNYIGTPYLNANFGLGTLFFEGKEAITASVRYHIAKELIEVELDGEVYYLNREVEVKFQEGLYKNFQYSENGKGDLKNGYFKLYPGTTKNQKLILLEKPVKGLIEAQAAAAMKTPQPAKYTDKIHYYLKFSDANFAVFAEQSEKKFLKAFPVEQQNLLENFIKENNLKIKKEEDLIKIVAFYNGRS